MSVCNCYIADNAVCQREDSYYSQDSHSRHSMSEMDRLSNHRKDPDGEDESEVIENYATEPPKPAHRKSIARYIENWHFHNIQYTSLKLAVGKNID